MVHLSCTYGLDPASSGGGEFSIIIAVVAIAVLTILSAVICTFTIRRRLAVVVQSPSQDDTTSTDDENSQDIEMGCSKKTTSVLLFIESSTRYGVRLHRHTGCILSCAGISKYSLLHVAAVISHSCCVRHARTGVHKLSMQTTNARLKYV